MVVDQVVSELLFSYPERRVLTGGEVAAVSGNWAQIFVSRSRFASTALVVSPVARAIAQAWRAARHAASARPNSVDGGSATNGHSSRAIASQSAVARSAPSTAYRPRLMRCSTAYCGGTFE